MAVEGELPQQLNNPFDYEPHPLCVEAARQMCAYVEHSPLRDEVMSGKMLGVLVCQRRDGVVGFLAAYSGQLCGRADWPWFVPAVFDYLQPDGYFKQEEARITSLNARIAASEHDPALVLLKERQQQQQCEATQAVEAFRSVMAEKKRRRDALRAVDDSLSNAPALIAESQHMKAELRRLKERWRQVLTRTAAELRDKTDAIARLKDERRQRSDALHHWLFSHFVMLNDRGEQRTLTDIFAATPQGQPPSGTGECCAPKLLQYAFAHQLKPLCIAELWQGASPRMEVRHHGRFYPACRGKCGPLLQWMLSLPQPAASCVCPALPIVYEDDVVLVVDKPSGLLSVPGTGGAMSVQRQLEERYGDIFMVHRLDQDTSGLMVVARSRRAHLTLQRQFLCGQIHKTYVALLDGTVSGSGTICLPLRPDIDDRPRQVVDYEHGKAAVTDYEVVDGSGSPVRVTLTPHTGRTHQLRVHCAHHDGLGAPIVGDRLYGRSNTPGQRLCLHAAVLSFIHPATGQPLTFRSAVPF